ncbi:DUF3307 domain-containing protein [Streptomyces sp. NPDC056454]|uniref:DUF3307 domain-containing protein n=1 Tax=Streptomyces sp. NPDC056454 TaxID=3345823 RepID=UPI003698995E
MLGTLFVLLYLGHLLADYPFQTDHQAAHKADCNAAGWAANLAHAATHVATCATTLIVGALLLDDVTLSVPVVVAALLWIGTTHAFIDRRWPVARWMTFAKQAGWAKNGGAAHVDQTAHVLALVVAALVLAA